MKKNRLAALTNSIRLFKIDWPNHIIGFFSALFGILIAFQLDEWREQSEKKELALTAFGNLKNEININQNILHEDMRLNLQLLKSLDTALWSVSADLKFECTKQKASFMNQHLNGLITVDTSGRSSPFPLHIDLGKIFVPALHSSAWESAKATGALNYMAYEKVILFSSLYNYSKISDELLEIKMLLRKTDAIKMKADLQILIDELHRACIIIQRELEQYDQFVRILEAME